jgi:hypothetical protein
MSDIHSPLSDPLRGVVRPTPALPVRRELERNRRLPPKSPRHPQTDMPQPAGGTPHIDEYARGI